MTQKITTINPTTGKSEFTYSLMSEEEAGAAARRVYESFEEWRRASVRERANLTGRLASLLEQRVEECATLMATEMGKPIRQGRAEIEKCAWLCRYFAENAEKFLQDEAVEIENGSARVAYRPLGVVLAIMPWNFPFWQVFRFAVPALLAGNGTAIKPALNVPQCALAIERLFRDAGFPSRLAVNLFVENERVSRLIEFPEISAVTLTGSTRAGKAVAAAAGQALKKTVLELGGSDPYLILKDADLDLAAEVCAKSRLVNSGQSCIAAKRFIVDEAVREEFQKKFIARIESAMMGNPLREDVEIGPQARFDLRETLHHQVKLSVDRGAKCLLGGEIPGGKAFQAGAFYPPTVLTNVARGMPAFDEEVFGPVAAIIPAVDTQGAITLANESVYGLGSAIFSRDLREAERIAREDLQAGLCAVNTMVRSDPRLPFGGVKHSGYGRELSRHGLLEFVNIKTIIADEAASGN